MVDFFCRQEKTFGLGNFINCTPTLKALSDYYKRTIPVYFESVGEAYKDCSFIEQIDRPRGKELFGSYDINSSMPDWEYIFRKVETELRIKLGDIPGSYIDNTFEDSPQSDDYYVVLRGCFSNIPYKVRAKDPGDDIYIKIIRDLEQRTDIKPYFIGTYDDYIRAEFMFKVLGKHLLWPKTTLREALNFVNHAKFVIGNDTGLVHAAAAMNKKTLCLWEKTNFNKNKARNPIDYSLTNHFENYRRWISTLL